MSTEYKDQLSLVKMQFIEKIVAEQSLDTLKEWYSMYTEAKYVASLDTDEEELKQFGINYKESIRRAFCK